MLQQFFILEIRKWHKIRSIIFQQDGAPSHFSIGIRHNLDNRLPNRWTGRDGTIRCASSSPELTPLNFYLWEHLKSNVYKSPIKDLDELKVRINIEIESISKRTLNKVFFRIL